MLAIEQPAEAKQKHEIRLVDDRFETADIVRRFLDAATGKSLPTPQTISLHQLGDSIRFAKKYDCPLICALLLSIFKESLGAVDASGKTHSSSTFFSIAAQLDEPEICSAALKLGIGNFHEHHRQGDNKDRSSIPGRPGFDIIAFPLASFRDLPIDYLWALGRVSLVSGDKAKAEEFKRLIEVAKRTPVAQS
ncbi:hypothetical protein BCR39DRAFT_561148 [Naematelia encephala]|uniref:Uncharacterized protein n=1 Tax=Naematelia encephala TaxID=71784 RepID=A0A1Y2AS04_9TREE|nr:hypothetical protein BCR39DRAFT_561148 [Naematelia encephala]